MNIAANFAVVMMLFGQMNRRFCGGFDKHLSSYPIFLFPVKLVLTNQTNYSINRKNFTGYHDEPDYVGERPFLLTPGDQDSAAILEQAPRWAKREPHCDYIIIPDAGHNANQDNAESFNETLQTFLLALVQVRCLVNFLFFNELTRN